MSYAYINREYMKNKPKFFLCLPYPRRTAMRKLTEIYNVDVKFILGRVHELSFDIPAKVERNHELVKNPLIDLFQGYYLVKMEWNGLTEYFVYTNGNRKSENGGKTLSYKMYSTSYLIGKTAVPIYEEESKNLATHASEFLKGTNWKLGYVDSEFNNTYRALELNQSNSLQALYDLAEKFKSVIKFDTVNQIVNFYKPNDSKLGIDKGFTFKDEVTVESLGYEIKFDEIVTRLHVYGSDGLEFRRLSPVGVNYIQDFSWFMHPFDYSYNSSSNTYTVLKSSRWLTDNLCIALLKYQKKVNDYTPTFKTLAQNKTIKQDDITQLYSKGSDELMKLNQVKNEIWVINKTYKEEAENRQDWKDAQNRKNAILSQIDILGNQILALEAEVATIDKDLNNLRVALSLESNFTSTEIVEMNNFVHHGYYTNDSITDDEDLLKDGTEAFKRVNQPPITMNLNIVNFLNDVKFEKVKDRISLGDIVKVRSDDLNVLLKLKIIEISYNLNSDNINITVSNEEDLRDDMAKMVDKIYSASHASITVSANKGNWDKGGEAGAKVDDILNNAWDTAKNAIIGGYQNTTTLDADGLKSKDSSSSNSFLFINNGIFGITSDGLSTIEVAIDKTGVHAKKLVGELILGNNLKLTSSNGVLEADGETLTVRDTNGNVKVELGKYTDPTNNQDAYGLNVIGGAIRIQTSTNPNEGTVIDENGIRVYDSSGNVVFDTSDPDNMSLSGKIIVSQGDIYATEGFVWTRELKLNDSSPSGLGSFNLDYFNNTARFVAQGSFSFNQDIFINGKKVLTEP